MVLPGQESSDLPHGLAHQPVRFRLLNDTISDGHLRDRYRTGSIRKAMDEPPASTPHMQSLIQPITAGLTATRKVTRQPPPNMRRVRPNVNRHPDRMLHSLSTAPVAGPPGCGRQSSVCDAQVNLPGWGRRGAHIAGQRSMLRDLRAG